MPRPILHYTAPAGWLNDPNGLVFHGDVWHLFFQHNPHGNDWGNMTWGHATSPDLVSWTTLPNAIDPFDGGTIFSGSAIVDTRNLAGLGDNALLAFYTFAKNPFDQRLAGSVDNGVTFTQHPKNPVVPNIHGENRDPKVFFDAPTNRYVMALYVPERRGEIEVHTIRFLTSENLTDWTHASTLDGFFECPDLVELAVENEPGTRKWVVFGADGRYRVGQFDGETFTPDDSGPQIGDYGPNFYAAQTYANVPESDGRTILIAWMRGGVYPGEPFNQQMTFPTSLHLRKIGENYRLCRRPVREIETVRRETNYCNLDGGLLDAGEDYGIETRGNGLWDVKIEVCASPETTVFLRSGACEIALDFPERAIRCAGATAPFPESYEADGLKLRVLIDTHSVEIFVGDGEICLSACFVPSPESDGSLRLESNGPASIIGEWHRLGR